MAVDPGRATARETGGAGGPAADTRRYVRAAGALALLVLALGVAVLLAWAFDLDAVKRVRPGFVPMTPASAIGFVVGGAALLLLLPQEPGAVRRRLARGLAAALVLLGAAAIVQYAFDLDLGIDRVLFREAVAADLGQPRGRPAPNTAAAFLLSGIALLFFTVRVPRRYAAAHLAALAAGFFALQAIGGYLYDVEDFYRVGRTTPMALNTAVGLVLLALGILLARPTRGLMATVTAADIGGYVARRLLPAAILVPVALGLVRTLTVEAGALSVAYALALVVVFNAAAFVALVWWNAAALSRLDARRSAAEAERQRALAAAEAGRAYLRTVLDQMPAGVIIADATGRMIVGNRQAEAIWRRPFLVGATTADDARYPGFHPDGRPYAPEEWPLARAVMRGETVAGEEIEIRRGDGTSGTIRASAAPVRAADGELIAGVVAISDVTEERRAEREREEVTKRLTLALEAGRMGTWEWDIRTGTVAWSRELEAIHGLEAGGFPGTFEAFREEVHPEDRERVASAIERAVRGEEPYHVEYRAARPDGEVRWLEAWGHVFRTPEGKPERMVGVCQDVTERKEAELASARLAAIVEASEDAIIGSTLDGIITSWNRGAERMYGYTAEEAVGRAVSMLVPPEIEDDVPAILERLRRGERIEHYETRRMRKDGRRLDVSLALSPIRDENGVVVGTAAIGRDVTERKRADAERERLLERERIARAEADRRAREEAALRRAAEAVTATFTVEEVIRRIAESALEATTADGAFVQRIDAAAQEIEVVAAEGRHTPPLGERFAYQGSATARVVEHGEPEVFTRVPAAAEAVPAELERHCADCAAVVVPLTDVGQPIGSLVLVRGPAGAPFREDEIARAGTFGRLASLAFRKVRLLESSERRRDELQRVMESRARLTRGFSHDVKNPLGAAEGQLALLEQGVLNGLRPEQREGVTRARRSIQTALRLIDSLVELARAEAGRVRLEYAVTDVRGAVRDVAEEYRAAAETKGLSLEVVLPEELPVIQTDPDRVRQVLGNLLSNAVKYTERGGIRVRVAARSGPPAPGPGAWVAVDVSDTGPGIPKDKQEEVFGEFARLEPGKGRGTGLGLAISRHLARALGGDITLLSEAGRGATFTLWLPRDGGPGPVQTEGGPPGESGGRQGESSGRPRAHDGASARGVDPSQFGAWSAAFLDHLEDYAVFMVDAAGRIIRWNRGAERTTGYSAADVLGRPFSIFYPKQEVERGAIEAEMRTALERGKFEERRWRYKADGTPFFASEILVPIRDEAGHPIGFAKIFRDLTEESLAEEEARAAETRLRLALEAGGLGDWELDLKTGESPRRSLRHDRIFGYEEPVEHWSYDRFMEHVQPEDRALVDRRFRAALEQGRPWDFECRIRRADGEVRWIWAKGMVHYDSEGEPDRAFGVIMDITERKRAEEELRLARDEAEAASRAKSDFLNVMSHELRTPLTAVIGYADVLEAGVDGELTPAQRERVDRIKASARHLVDLIEEILTFSRMESGREEVRCEPVDLAALARATADVVRPSADEKGLRFEVELPDGPVPAETDPSKVRRILLNLLSNAVRFTPSGAVGLRMRVERDCVVFVVWDTGVGIAREHLEHVFEPFWQAAAALTREVGGTGLGLTVARRLARMLGGDVALESEVGKGSTFTVRLPR